MIFWTGVKPGYLVWLANVALVENVCVVASILPWASKSYYQGYAFFCNRNGLGVVRRFAFIYSDRIVVYPFVADKHPDYHDNKVEFSLPIVDEFCDMDDFPDSFAIRTENIELLRELIANGKKVSWLEPNLVKFSSDIVNLKFEHLFIDPFTEHDLVLPTGEYSVSFVPRGKGDERFSKVCSLLMASNIPFAKMIGFNFIGLENRMDKHKYYRARIAKGKKAYKNRPLSFYFAIAFYNILSITYMLCKKTSFATNAKNEIVPKE